MDLPLPPLPQLALIEYGNPAAGPELIRDRQGDWWSLCITGPATSDARYQLEPLSPTSPWKPVSLGNIQAYWQPLTYWGTRHAHITPEDLPAAPCWSCRTPGMTKRDCVHCLIRQAAHIVAGCPLCPSARGPHLPASPTMPSTDDRRDDTTPTP